MYMLNVILERINKVPLSMLSGLIYDLKEKIASLNDAKNIVSNLYIYKNIVLTLI